MTCEMQIYDGEEKCNSQIRFYAEVLTFEGNNINLGFCRDCALTVQNQDNEQILDERSQPVTIGLED